jgi:hypothetical protein
MRATSSVPGLRQASSSKIWLARHPAVLPVSIGIADGAARHLPFDNKLLPSGAALQQTEGVFVKSGDLISYRYDANGRWSHKRGSTAATDLDNAGRVILNPELADRGEYDIFCGYYEVNITAVRLA